MILYSTIEVQSLGLVWTLPPTNQLHYWVSFVGVVAGGRWQNMFLTNDTETQERHSRDH